MTNSVQIKNNSLFLVQTNEDMNSIRYDVIKESIAPIALQENSLSAGIPGLMFPGSTMIYDELTGKLDVSSSAIREYVGLIGYVKDIQTPSMQGGELSGNFYVVADFNYKYLQNDWATIGSDLNQRTRVYLGDIVERDNDGSGDWKVIPMQIGNQHVHNDFEKYPHISAVVSDSIFGVDNDSPGVSGDSILQTSGYD